MASIADYAKPNPVNQNRSGIIGRAVHRYEGPLKVTGSAPYAYEVEPPSPPVYGVLISAPIARGRITAVDTAAAEASPGVQLIWTYRNVPAQGPRPERYDFFTPFPRPALESDEVHFFGQQVAIVVADTLENAQAGAALVNLTFEDDAKSVIFHDHYDQAVQPPGEADVEIGDFEAAFAAAPVKIDDTWRTPLQNHCQMEPCATTAWWEDDKVVVHTSTQMIKRPQHLIAETLGIARDRVHLMSRYVGGGLTAGPPGRHAGRQAHRHVADDHHPLRPARQFHGARLELRAQPLRGAQPVDRPSAGPP